MMKLLLLAGTAFASGVACAQDARPVRMIVPFSGGSASDVITRIVIERITATTGQRYVLDNRPAGSPCSWPWTSTSQGRSGNRCTG